MSGGELELVVSALVQIADDLDRVARSAASLGPEAPDLAVGLFGSLPRRSGLGDAIGRSFEGARRSRDRLEIEAAALARAVEHILWVFETTDQGLAQLVMGPDRHLGVAEP